mmetsp:Transcript_7518/g.19512  ORF Transcript_7518/g.19512 Transcript_7518/m.19512 type:complete len:340 (-) Transcript_7518:249-1268(-)
MAVSFSASPPFLASSATATVCLFLAVLAASTRCACASSVEEILSAMSSVLVIRVSTSATALSFAAMPSLLALFDADCAVAAAFSCSCSRLNGTSASASAFSATLRASLAVLSASFFAACSAAKVNALRHSNFALTSVCFFCSAWNSLSRSTSALRFSCSWHSRSSSLFFRSRSLSISIVCSDSFFSSSNSAYSSGSVAFIVSCSSSVDFICVNAATRSCGKNWSKLSIWMPSLCTRSFTSLLVTFLPSREYWHLGDLRCRSQRTIKFLPGALPSRSSISTKPSWVLLLIASSVLVPRSVSLRVPPSPIAKALTMEDLPVPFGPTMQLRRGPGSNSSASE